MLRRLRVALLLGLLAAGLLLAGCPGMPGMPGAGGGAGAEQKTPPGVLPPPGLESGGVRTLMGTTITAPENSYLLVRFARVRQQPTTLAEAKWQSCRRVTLIENCLTVEGINYDGRDDAGAKDANVLIAYSDLTGFDWKYEARPAPPAQPAGKGQPKPSPKPR